MVSLFPDLKTFDKDAMQHLPRVFIKYASCLPKKRKNGEVVVNSQKKIRSFGSNSGIVLNLKRIILSPKWNTSWLILLPEKNDWYIVKDIYWK